MRTDRNDEANSHFSQFFERVKNSINSQKIQNTQNKKLLGQIVYNNNNNNNNNNDRSHGGRTKHLCKM